LVKLRVTRATSVEIQWADNDSLIYDDQPSSDRWQIYRAAVDGSPPVCLTCDLADRASVRSGGVSPSGNHLAFINAVVPSPLYVLDLRSRRVTMLTDAVKHPVWAASDRLLFVSGRDGIEDIWEVTIDSVTGQRVGDPVRVTSGLDVNEFSVTDAGRRIMVTRDMRSSHIWVLPVGPSRLTDLTQARRLTTGSARDTEVRWAPDGSIVFTSDRRGGLDIWRLPPGSETPIRLTNTGQAEKPQVSPDGRWITFNHPSGVQWIMRFDGSDVRTIGGPLGAYAVACCADWSRDGTALTLLTWDAPSSRGRVGLLEMDPAAGRAQAGSVRRLSSLPANASFGRWSPDSRILAYVADSNLWVVRRDGERARQVTDLPGSNTGPVWQRQPLTLYFVHDGTSIWRLPMNDDGTPAGSPRPWFDLPAGSRRMFTGLSLDINQAGDQMVAAIRQLDLDLWLVERTPATTR
jgi:Tol biopolymer transport system component